MEWAKLLAKKLHTTEEKVVKAIIHAEESRQMYRNIREKMAKQKSPLTQVDVLSDMGGEASELMQTKPLTFVQVGIWSMRVKSTKLYA